MPPKTAGTVMEDPPERPVVELTENWPMGRSPCLSGLVRVVPKLSATLPRPSARFVPTVRSVR